MVGGGSSKGISMRAATGADSKPRRRASRTIGVAVVMSSGWLETFVNVASTSEKGTDPVFSLLRPRSV